MEPWPTDAAKLSRGGNDTWNAFQRFNVGRSVTVEEWKAARKLLLEEQELQRAQQHSEQETEMTALQNVEAAEEQLIQYKYRYLPELQAIGEHLEQKRAALAVQRKRLALFEEEVRALEKRCREKAVEVAALDAQLILLPFA